ncbi:sigma-70 family RNA polymerase sigma factor [Blastopirellula sp. J2-11]|uniref:sigma-70 family RNA polymerase sigma factor n=1 Tax=Blastopirellula sp. J2-11 TaxID=2943192 RepID=UPI0021C8B78A|nr:sigma-70 family RNA polymerase sigma factor [Blastopirellula sp. J2-11]UUO08706.1 sigma-70 family RNA polymerase sigma factor [Blastopirellula sp. J2-11]
MQDSERNEDSRASEFVQLLGSHQRQLVLYLTSLLHDRDAVDDVFQETMLVLWREFHSYEAGTNFTAWSCRVAYNQVRAWRKKQQRDRLQFSDEFLDAVNRELEMNADHLRRRDELLAHCLAKLPVHHRQLIQYRYSAGEAVTQIAEQTDRSIEAVYRLLSRIRRTLHECVNRQMAKEDNQ